jgi:hypothetical protein
MQEALVLTEQVFARPSAEEALEAKEQQRAAGVDPAEDLAEEAILAPKLPLHFQGAPTIRPNIGSFVVSLLHRHASVAPQPAREVISRV